MLRWSILTICILILGNAWSEGIEETDDDGLKITCPINYKMLYYDEAHTMPACIRFYESSKGDWDTMRSHCKADGASLARPEGYLFYEIQDYILTHPYLSDDGFWIGGLYNSATNSWEWEDGTSMPPEGTSPWHKDQPDDVTHSHFACMYTPDFDMHSCVDGITINAICQV